MERIVEKIVEVEKEVIKEVPIEKIVEKEVIKEVPVEKIVEKIVEVEVIKEVPVQIANREVMNEMITDFAEMEPFEEEAGSRMGTFDTMVQRCRSYIDGDIPMSSGSVPHMWEIPMGNSMKFWVAVYLPCFFCWGMFP